MSILNFSGNKMLRFRQSPHFCAVCVVLPGIYRCFLFVSAWQRWRNWNSFSIQLNWPNWQVTIMAHTFLPLMTSLIKLGSWTRVAQLELRTNTPTVVTWYWRQMPYYMSYYLRTKMFVPISFRVWYRWLSLWKLCM